MKMMNLMRQIRCASFMMAVMFFMPMMVMAADIHVATNGSDDNPGTLEAPLLTIHKAMEPHPTHVASCVHGRMRR